MGTRGFVGFVVDGTEKITYNHSDSYPGGLGLDVLGWLRKVHIGGARREAAALRVVSPSSQPTTEDIEKLSDYANRSVSSGQIDEWYVLLRGTMGSPAAMLDAGVIQDAASFPMDSVMAEYGYLVDFDAETFEAYRGFQKEPHTKGRFATREPHFNPHASTAWQPCALVGSWPLSDLPSDDDFLKVADPDPDDED
jgi:hypothetical protein